MYPGSNLQILNTATAINEKITIPTRKRFLRLWGEYEGRWARGGELTIRSAGKGTAKHKFGNRLGTHPIETSYASPASEAAGKTNPPSI